MKNNDVFDNFLKNNRPTPKDAAPKNLADGVWQKVAKTDFYRLTVFPAATVVLLLSVYIAYRAYMSNETYFEVGRNLETSFNLPFLRNGDIEVVGDLVSLAEADDDDDDDDSGI